MYFADLHIHSKYSRATSRECVPEYLDLWARKKGLAVIGTGDFTHPQWRRELLEKLEPAEEGLYRLKKEHSLPCNMAGEQDSPRFLVSGEISSIYKKNGKVRKVHNLILLPDLMAAEKLAHRLEMLGNVHSDGRPILGLDSRDLLELMLEVCPTGIFIPAHIWTPHFSLFGAYSGFDTIEECFEDLTPHIHALETGLSSDPPMNWQLSALDGYRLVSNSDAHSPAKLAREANALETERTYPAIARALKEGDGFCGTLEFFPEEGKYHYDGHRNCGVCLKPGDTVKAQGICPVCGKRITVGVLHRVEELADRAEGYRPSDAPAFRRVAPLPEVIAASTGIAPGGVKAARQSDELLAKIGSELYILLEAPLTELEQKAGPCIAEGIRRLRVGEVHLSPGFDGEYGKVGLLTAEEIERFSGQIEFQGMGRQSGMETGRPVPAPDRVEALPRLAGRRPKTTAHREQLNLQQLAAVQSRAAEIVVTAGPGTGKTRTLVRRICYLIEKGVRAEEITAVTFTNQAAKEMQLRLEKEPETRKMARAVTIGTFHNLCLQLLEHMGKNFSVIGEDEAAVIAEEVIGRFALKMSVKAFLQRLSKRKNQLDIKMDAALEEAFQSYQDTLARYEVLDYDDLLLNVLEAMEKGHLKTEELKQFTYLLVDEFQDINPVQYQLIKKWHEAGANLFVIGDPDQAIYGFRGADSACFQTLKVDFPKIEEIQLLQNYRSTPEIIGCAGSFIQRHREAPFLLRAERRNGAPVRLVSAETSLSSAIFVAKEIAGMVGGMDMLEAHASKKRRGERSFSDIAVLYRTNQQAALLEECLQKEDIPYLVRGRDDFLSDPAVRRVIAFFRFLCNPADRLALRMTLEYEEIPEREREWLLEQYLNVKTPSVAAYLQLKKTSEKARGLDGGLEAFRLRLKKDRAETLVKERTEEFLGMKWREQLIGMAELYKTMPEFIQNITFGEEGDLMRGGRSYSPDAVSLMTLHAAKGLEFPVVILYGVEKNLIPFRAYRETDQEEEGHLFYVGMTRAMDELILLHTSEPSPYIQELDTAYVEVEQALKPNPRIKQLTFF